jgi:serine/threonine protein kinase
MDNYAFRKYTNSRHIKDLINKMLVKNPDHRITPEKALRHPFFEKHKLAENLNYVIKESNNNNNTSKNSLPE